MKFEVSQRFQEPAEAVLSCYASSEMHLALPEFGKISRPELVDRSESGDTIRVQLRYRFTAELPSAALAIIDPERLTWIEDTTYDLRSMTAATKLLPDHYGSKLQASATVRFVDAGDGSIRTVAGDLRVRVLLVGGQVERAIISGLTEHLEEEADLVADLLDRS